MSLKDLPIDLSCWLTRAAATSVAEGPGAAMGDSLSSVPAPMCFGSTSPLSSSVSHLLTTPLLSTIYRNATILPVSLSYFARAPSGPCSQGQWCPNGACSKSSLSTALGRTPLWYGCLGEGLTACPLPLLGLMNMGFAGYMLP